MVTLEDFRKKREAVEKGEDLDSKQQLSWQCSILIKFVIIRIKKRKSKVEGHKLSFDFGGDEEEEEDQEKEQTIVKNIVKNPEVDTSFLKDKEREQIERIEREQLKQLWREQQELIKEQTINLIVAYHTGLGLDVNYKLTVCIIYIYYYLIYLWFFLYKTIYKLICRWKKEIQYKVY